MKNIFITWTSKGIWKYLLENLSSNNLFSISWKSHVDISDKIQVTNYVKENIPRDLNLDYIILNAWIWEFWNFEDHDLDKYEKIINTNLFWNIALLKNLEQNINKNTKIIFVGSIISKKFMKWACVYQASKFWIRWLAWWLKSEWKKVYLINPKIVDTDFHKDKVNLDKSFPETKLIDILEVVENILLWKETRFEIDL